MAGQEISLEGYLEKLGEKGIGANRYKKRYFKLEGTELHYYTSPSTCASKKTLGHIDCNKVTDVEPITSDEQLSSNNKRSSLKRNSVAPVVGARFDIHTQERIYHLMAPSQGEMLHWVGSLSNLISSLKKEQIRNENTFIKKREVSSDSKQVRSQIGNRASLILSRPSSEVAPTPPSPQRFEPQETFKKVNVEEVVIFLERVSSSEFRDAHFQQDRHLERSLLEFRDMKAVRDRENTEKHEIENQIPKISELEHLTRKELEKIAALDKSVTIVKQTMEKRQNICNDADKTYRTIESLQNQLSKEHKIYLDINEKLDHLQKRAQAPSMISHHDTNVKQVYGELEQLPQKIEEVDKQLQKNEIELTTINNEKIAASSQKIKIPEEIRKINNRKVAIAERIEQLNNLLRDARNLKAALEEAYAELQKKKAMLAKQESSLNMFKKILNEPSWAEMMSTFSIISNLEQQANSLMADLGERESGGSVATIDVDKKGELDRKAQLMSEKFESEKRELTEKDNSLQEAVAANEKEIRDLTKELANLQREAEALDKEKSDYNEKTEELIRKIEDSEKRKEFLDREQEKLLERKRDLSDQLDDKQRNLEKERRLLRDETQRKAELESEINSQEGLKRDAYKKLCEFYFDAVKQVEQLENLKKYEKSLNKVLTSGIEEQAAIRAERQSILKERLKIINDLRSECLKFKEMMDASNLVGRSSEDFGDTVEISELLARLKATESSLELARQSESSLREQILSLKSKQISDIESDKSSVNRQMEQISNDYQFEIKRLNSKIQELQSRADSAESNARNYQSELLNARSSYTPAPVIVRDPQAPVDNQYILQIEEELKKLRVENAINREQSYKYRDLSTRLETELREAKELISDLNTSSSEIRRLEEECRTLKVDLVLNNEEANRYRDQALSNEEELNELRKDKKHLKKKIGELDSIVKNSSANEKDLKQKEWELSTLTNLYNNLEMTVKIHENDKQNDRERIRQQNEELRAKDLNIMKLQEQLQRSRPPQGSNNNKKGPVAPPSPVPNYLVEIESLRSNLNGIINSKEKEIDLLSVQLESLRNEYQRIRNMSLTNAGADENLVKEMENIDWMKKEYFYSLAVGVKLELSKEGTPCNLDIGDMFQEACYTVNVKQWHTWITKKFVEAAQSTKLQRDTISTNKYQQPNNNRGPNTNNGSPNSNVQRGGQPPVRQQSRQQVQQQQMQQQQRTQSQVYNNQYK